MEKGFLLSGQMAKAQYAENKKKMKHPLRSAVTTTGRRMAGARSLWRANGMREEQFGRPVIGIANSFTQLVPGHVHLHEIGQYVKQRIEALGCFAAEFNTIAIDDGIAMGHDGMLYSLPSREIIADSVEYMANAHKVDALVCISNCDKITPGMLMAAMRLDIPTVFVSGGPMEAGHLGERALDLIDAMVMAADENCSDEQVARVERAACPGCGSCSGMFTANSMNCLTEALGLSLPGNGIAADSVHARVKAEFDAVGRGVLRQRDRQAEGADNRARRRPQRGHDILRHGGLHRAQPLARENLKPLDAVFLAPVQQLTQLRQAGFLEAQHQRTAAAVGEVQLAAELFHHPAALHVEARLLRSRHRVEACVDDGGVGLARPGADVLIALYETDLPCVAAQLTRHRAADHAAADHHGIPHRKHSLSCKKATQNQHRGLLRCSA